MSIPPSHVYVAEAPESIDRSSNEAYQADRDEFNPGETLRFKRATFVNENPEVWTFRVDQDGGRHKVGPATKIGRISPSARWTAGPPGRYEIHTRPIKPDKPKSERPDTKITGYTVEPGDGNAGEETVGSAGDWTNTEEPSNPLGELADKPGFVNDGDGGAEVAPALRDEVDMTVDDVVSSSSSDVDDFADRVASTASSSTSSSGSSSASSSSGLGIGQVPGILVVAAAVVAGWWWFR